MKLGLPDLIWGIPVEMTLSQQINLQAAQRLTVQVALGRQLNPFGVDGCPSRCYNRSAAASVQFRTVVCRPGL